MSADELTILLDGILLGMELMLLLFIGFDMRADRRARKRLKAAEQRLAAARKETGR